MLEASRESVSVTLIVSRRDSVTQPLHIGLFSGTKVLRSTSVLLASKVCLAMLDIAFISLLDFLVRNQNGPEQLPEMLQKSEALIEKSAKGSKIEACDRVLTDPLRSPNHGGD